MVFISKLMSIHISCIPDIKKNVNSVKDAIIFPVFSCICPLNTKSL